MGLFDFFKTPTKEQAKTTQVQPHFWVPGGQTMSPHEFGFMAVKYGFENARTFFDETIAGGQFGEQLVFIPKLIAKRGRAEMMLVAYCTASLLFTVTKIVSGEVMETIMKGASDGINSIMLPSGESLPKQVQGHICQEVINLVVAIDEWPYQDHPRQYESLDENHSERLRK